MVDEEFAVTADILRQIDMALRDRHLRETLRLLRTMDAARREREWASSSEERSQIQREIESMRSDLRNNLRQLSAGQAELPGPSNDA